MRNAQHPGSVPLAPVFISFFSIAAFLLVMWFSIKPVEENTKTLTVQNVNLNTNTTDETSLVNSETANVNDTPNVETNTNTAVVANNVFSFDNAKVGDKVAEMQITSIGPFFADRTDVEPNRKVEFSGRATITGRILSREGIGLPVCIQEFDSVSVKLIPILDDETRNNVFCFNNDDMGIDSFPIGTDTVTTVTIDNFTINSYPTAVSNVAMLIEANPTSGWTSFMDPSGRYTFKYPPNGTVTLVEGVAPKVIFPEAEFLVNVTSGNFDPNSPGESVLNETLSLGGVTWYVVQAGDGPCSWHSSITNFGTQRLQIRASQCYGGTNFDVLEPNTFKTDTSFRDSVLSTFEFTTN